MTHLCLPHKALQAVHVLDGLQGERQSSGFYKKGRGEDGKKKATSKKNKKLQSVCVCVCAFSHLKFKVLQNLSEQERIATLCSVQKCLNPVITETVTD